MLNTWLLCTGVELYFGAGVWGEAEKIFFFFALPGKGGHRELMVQKLCSNLGEFREESMVQVWVANKEQGVSRVCPPLIWSQVVSGGAPMLP